MKTVEELLKPRFKVIADYPRSKFKVGNILIESKSISGWCCLNGLDVLSGYAIEELDKYPHLFRKLEWWEEREEKDLPVYIRFGDYNKAYSIYKVDYLRGEDLKGYENFTPCGFDKTKNDYFISLRFPNNYPATEEEYLTYKKGSGVGNPKGQ